MTLTDVEARVLGSLIEKEITTPENYPLSLNALRNACNQSSSREPVMALQEDEIRQALHLLQEKGLADTSQDGRVAKFEHRVRDVLQLRRDEVAVLCLLLLRGAQTAGEIRSRSERLYGFDGPEAVLATLQRMAGREEPLTVLLARAPGAREVRWAQTFTAIPEAGAGAREVATSRGFSAPDTGLAEEVAELRREVEALKERLSRLEGA